MATIIQKPDTLSLSRNLKELIISTSSKISLQLLKGDSLLLEETYLPDVNNRVHVDLADIVTSTLSLTMPSGDAVSTSQSSVYSDFTVKVDGTSVAEFTAVRSGVERFSDTAANFLTANWLTWQPQVKEVLHDQPEWLTYYPASGSCACYARFYYTDGTSGEIKVCDVSQCVSINTRFSKLWALDESGKERYGVIDVYIKDAQGLRLTYVQRYVLCSQGALDEVYLCENSLGGLDTFRFYGDRKLVPEIGYTSQLLDNSYTAADPDLSRKWSQNTGMLTGRECEWCWELFRSSAAYHLCRGTILPIVLDASSVEKSAMSVLAAYSFDYRYASDLGLLNVVRSENLPEVVEISGPDAEVFFLTPRLNEFPSAVLSDDLIIPVQSPYEESWYTLSVGGLKSALLSSVETIYGPMWHVHDNLQVLNLLSVDEKGNLLYNGLAVGSGIVGAHDHHGETIRPEKIIVGDVEITCVDGRLHISKGLVSDGDLAAFGAEEGEEGGSGGLDIARLWEELEAEDTSKVIDVSHIPGAVVLQDELIEVLDDYPLTTEMNEALSGKAGKDWVEDELAKYLLLTGGKISGDLEVTGTLKIGEAVLSYQDGRLRISKGVVSDGDLAAFGAEEGEEGGSGGLDIARLWEELEAEDSSKVIDVSHIPGSVVLQDELTEILDDYPLTTEMNEALAGKAALQHTHAIADVTNLQNALNSKWEWNASQVAGVKVNSAFAADKLASSVKINGTDFNGESDIITARWGSARTITVWDFYNVNKQASQGIDGSANISLKLPQSIKVKTLSIDGVTLSVVGGRLHVDSTLTADGDLVAYGDGDGSSGGGLDEEAMWAALGGSMSSKVISPSHLPSLSSLSGNLDSSRITGLDSALTSYAKKDGSNATGTWPVSISGNAATADISNYLFLNPNNGTHASQNDAVPANGRFAIYDVNTATTAGGSDGYIMAFRWPSGNFATQVFLDADDTGIMALRHRNNSNVWTDWYRILHSGNIGSYALTPSNYTSTLDSRYVNVYGDTMTGTLNISSSSEALIRYQISGSNKAASGYLTGTGAYLYSWPAGKYLHITDAGSLLFGGSTVWHSGNDGSGSGLDADLLDGLHSASLRYLSIYNPSSSGVLVRTDISSNANIMFSVHIWGNTYGGAARPIDSRLEFYSYAANDAMLEYSLQNNGCAISSVKVFCYNGYVYIWLPYIKIYMSYSVYVNTTNTDRDRNYAVEISSGGVPSGATRVVTVTPKNVALTTDNVASATKLANSRTLWGRPFDGTANVSGDMTGVGSITASGFLLNTNNVAFYDTSSKANRISMGWSSNIARIYAISNDGNTYRDLSLGQTQGNSGSLYFDASAARWGIGTTSPAYKLDVAGTLRASGLITASAGVQVGSTDDYGWYIYSSRICAGVGVARGVNAGSLLVSSAWADYTKVPTNGIYSKGDIITGGRLFIPSSEGNDKYYIRIE